MLLDAISGRCGVANAVVSIESRAGGPAGPVLAVSVASKKFKDRLRLWNRVMTQNQEACCSSPATICYWFAASLCAWGLLSLVGIYWRPLHGSSASTILFAMAIGCAANWLRNRTYHCAITGPIFLIAGFVFLLPVVVTFRVNPSWVWSFVLIGVGAAFLLEWRYAKRPTSRP